MTKEIELPETRLVAGAQEDESWSDLSRAITEGAVAGAIGVRDAIKQGLSEIKPLELVEKAAMGAVAGAVKAAANEIPKDLTTVPELKLLTADHGKVTANRKAGDWNIDTHADGAEVWNNKTTGTKLTNLKDGTKIAELKDGNTIITRPDGTTITRDGEGIMTYKKPDGSGVLQWKDGRQDAIPKDDPKKDAYEGKDFKPMPDGSKVYENDYVKVTRTKDGTQVEQFKAEPKVEIVTKADGTKITNYNDGTKITEKPDGTKHTQWKDHAMTQLPDGTTILDERKTFGFTLTTKPDGTRHTEKNDGSTVTEFPDGTIKTVSKDGKVSIEQKKK